MQRDGEYIPHATVGPYPLRAGNRVSPLVDGEPAFRRICAAAESAQKSVWVAVAFLVPDFEMPDGRGSLFDVLDAAVDRGLDVRVIFWRHRLLAEVSPHSHFAGTAADRLMLRDRGSRFPVRWDQAYDNYCQHQKSWIIDAGEAGGVGFVGGINLSVGSCVPVGHPPQLGGTSRGTDENEGNTHDVYVELEGPSVTDVHHNFVQRWNEASDRDLNDGLWPDASSQDLLSFPKVSSKFAGEAHVQIQRTVRRGRYRDGRAVPGGEAFNVEAGDFSVIDQYRVALDAARTSIYVEDQAIGSREVVDRLEGALERGVEVVVLVPKDANNQMATARQEPKSKPFFDALAALGEHENFTLACVAQNLSGGGYQNIYVHSKIVLVDDVWCTIGSANIGNRSFYGDTEMNASFWHAETVKRLRVELLLEHLAIDTSDKSDAEALQLYAQIARENAERYSHRKPLAGLAFAVDPASYGK